MEKGVKTKVYTSIDEPYISNWNQPFWNVRNAHFNSYESLKNSAKIPSICLEIEIKEKW